MKSYQIRVRQEDYEVLRNVAFEMHQSLSSVVSLLVARMRSEGGFDTGKIKLAALAPPKPAVMPVRAKNAPFTPDELEVLNSYEVYMHHVVSMVPGSTMKEEYDALPTSQQLEEAQRWWDMDMDSPKNNEYSIYRTWETFDARDATVTPLELPEGYEDLDIEE